MKALWSALRQFEMWVASIGLLVLGWRPNYPFTLGMACVLASCVAGRVLYLLDKQADADEAASNRDAELAKMRADIEEMRLKVLNLTNAASFRAR